MEPYYSDAWLTIYAGDCRTVLTELPADSVDCVVTSPPYWGLRDYGTATWIGGDDACAHIAPPTKPRSERPNPSGAGIGKGGASWDAQEQAARVYRDTCRDCGAIRIDSQLGLERTPEEYVANMVAVFREVRRVLKPSGTCWLNLGDSYASGGENRNGKSGSGLNSNPAADVPMKAVTRGLAVGLKPKDLVGIPWRVAFALQADGWYLRSDIIWSKPNPMPESVTDRPTKSHEYLFLLTKSARYYFDADAVRESFADERMGNPGRYRWTYGQATGKGSGDTSLLGDDGIVNGWNEDGSHAGRNIRSVWNIATRPYPGAHFAVFPPELPERCIKAGSSEKGVCPECGAPWERVVERTGADMTARYERGEPARHGTAGAAASKASNVGAFTGIRATSGWLPACQCGSGASSAPLVAAPAVILDPFGGSGTVGMVANRLSRRAIIIDLNPEYLKQQMTRNSQVPLGLTEGDAA